MKRAILIGRYFWLSTTSTHHYRAGRLGYWHPHSSVTEWITNDLRKEFWRLGSPKFYANLQVTTKCSK